MKQNIVSLSAGFLFGIGLALSKMIDPEKVLNFLDFTGNWDPSLALVMAGALSIAILAFHFIPHRAAPLFDEKFRLPKQSKIDKPLLFGAMIFGIGWGMAGFCPGPAIANLGFGGNDIVIFVLSMIAGVIVHSYTSRKISH